MRNAFQLCDNCNHWPSCPTAVAIDGSICGKEVEIRTCKEFEPYIRSAVTRKYGTDSAFHGLILAVVDSFAASLRLIADEQDLAIAEEISKHITACTIHTRGGKK